MTETQTAPPLKVYWQPGCSSCLKTKEFLLENGIEFESINVLEDETGFRDLEALGLRLVPVVARGANGAVFREVARVAGFEWQPTPPEPCPTKSHKVQNPAEMRDLF